MTYSHLSNSELVAHVLAQENLSELESELLTRLELALDVVHEYEEASEPDTRIDFAVLDILARQAVDDINEGRTADARNTLEQMREEWGGLV